jgi:hypothetical protein
LNFLFEAKHGARDRILNAQIRFRAPVPYRFPEAESEYRREARGARKGRRRSFCALILLTMVPKKKNLREE